MPKPKLTPEDLDKILAGEDVRGEAIWMVKDWNTPKPEPSPVPVHYYPEDLEAPNLNIEGALPSYDQGMADAQRLYENNNPYPKTSADLHCSDHRSWAIGFLEYAHQEKCRLENE